MVEPDLSEFLRNQTRSRSKRVPCLVAKALSELGKEERAQLQAALDVPTETISGNAIAQWLEPRGYKLPYMQVANHRRRNCKCYE